MDNVTWVELLRRYLVSKAWYAAGTINGVAETNAYLAALAPLKECPDYWSLAPVEKISLLRFLCDAALEADNIRSDLFPNRSIYTTRPAKECDAADGERSVPPPAQLTAPFLVASSPNCGKQLALQESAESGAACKEKMEQQNSLRLQRLGVDAERCNYWLIGGHVFREGIDAVFNLVGTTELEQISSKGNANREQNDGERTTVETCTSVEEILQRKLANVLNLCRSHLQPDDPALAAAAIRLSESANTRSAETAMPTADAAKNTCAANNDEGDEEELVLGSDARVMAAFPDSVELLERYELFRYEAADAPYMSRRDGVVGTHLGGTPQHMPALEHVQTVLDALYGLIVPRPGAAATRKWKKQMAEAQTISALRQMLLTVEAHLRPLLDETWLTACGRDKDGCDVPPVRLPQMFFNQTSAASRNRSAEMRLGYGSSAGGPRGRTGRLGFRGRSNASSRSATQRGSETAVTEKEITIVAQRTVETRSHQRVEYRVQWATAATDATTTDIWETWESAARLGEVAPKKIARYQRKMSAKLEKEKSDAISVSSIVAKASAKEKWALLAQQLDNRLLRPYRCEAKMIRRLGRQGGVQLLPGFVYDGIVASPSLGRSWARQVSDARSMPELGLHARILHAAVQIH
eukprot:SAG31_NODE_2323_length_5941_cov_3.155255_5_plen_639_part_00